MMSYFWIEEIGFLIGVEIDADINTEERCFD